MKNIIKDAIDLTLLYPDDKRWDVVGDMLDKLKEHFTKIDQSGSISPGKMIAQRAQQGAMEAMATEKVEKQNG